MKTGKEIIQAIIKRLKDKNIPPHDYAILAELRELNKYQVNQLTTFGDIDKWIQERNKNNSNS